MGVLLCLLLPPMILVGTLYFNKSHFSNIICILSYLMIENGYRNMTAIYFVYSVYYYSIKRLHLQKMSTFLYLILEMNTFRDVFHVSLIVFLVNSNFRHLVSSLLLHGIISSDIAEKRHLYNKLRSSTMSCRQVKSG